MQTWKLLELDTACMLSKTDHGCLIFGRHIDHKMSTSYLSWHFVALFARDAAQCRMQCTLRLTPGFENAWHYQPSQLFICAVIAKLPIETQKPKIIIKIHLALNSRILVSRGKSHFNGIERGGRSEPQIL